MFLNCTLKKMGLALAIATFCSYANAVVIENDTLTTIAKQEEQKIDARIGIAIIDTADNGIVSYRGDERFPMNSTHKSLLCGVLLNAVDNGTLSLAERVHYDKSKLVTYSPVTEKFVNPASMNWSQVCSAAVSYSDNTAANLISERLGGPDKITHFLRQIGDYTTRLDRYEPELNSAIPGDERDTTTPVAISQTLNKLILGDVLKPSSRQQLRQWMVEDKVADALLRSVLPANWKVADKTGAGDYGSRGIISVVWPEHRPPFIITIYITQTNATMTQSNEAIARIGNMIFSKIQGQ